MKTVTALDGVWHTIICLEYFFDESDRAISYSVMAEAVLASHRFSQAPQNSVIWWLEQAKQHQWGSKELYKTHGYEEDGWQSKNYHRTVYVFRTCYGNY